MSIRTKLSPLGYPTKPFKKGEIIVLLDLKDAVPEKHQSIIKKLPKNKYFIKLVGGGGGDGGAYGAGIWYGSGGSGAAFIGRLLLSKGTYRFTCGSRGNNTPGVNQPGGTDGISSKLEKLKSDGTWEILIEAGGGKTGIWLGGPGDGGIIDVRSEIIDYKIKQNGNPGKTGGMTGDLLGGESLYNGYGHGCGTYGTGGTGGYVELSSL